MGTKPSNSFGHINRTSQPAPLPKLGPQTAHNAERDFILDTLKQTKWVISGPNGAAERLGMSRTTLQYRIRRLGIIKQWH